MYFTNVLKSTFYSSVGKRGGSWFEFYRTITFFLSLLAWVFFLEDDNLLHVDRTDLENVSVWDMDGRWGCQPCRLRAIQGYFLNMV